MKLERADPDDGSLEEPVGAGGAAPVAVLVPASEELVSLVDQTQLLPHLCKLGCRHRQISM